MGQNDGIGVAGIYGESKGCAIDLQGDVVPTAISHGAVGHLQTGGGQVATSIAEPQLLVYQLDKQTQSFMNEISKHTISVKMPCVIFWRIY